MHVVIFEGSRWPTFAPVALSRPVFSLVSGSSTLLSKQVRHLRPSRLTLWVRPELEEYCRARIVPKQPFPTDVNTPLGDEPALLMSGRTVLFSSYEPPQSQCIVTEGAGEDPGDGIRAAYVQSPGLTPADVMQRTDRWLKFLDLPRSTAQGRLVETLWDLIHWNEESLIEDAIQFQDHPHPHPAGPYHLIHENDVWLGQGVTIGPGCVLDASHGPVMLGNNVTLGANCVIEGPCSIDHHSTLTPLTIIRAGTTIGPLCKVGGEVSNSIMMGYTSKVHEGFLGDSYLGRWVNMGAGTTTSNLKNTYGEITIKRGGKEVPTGRRFLGALIGDHTRTGILTRLMAGTYLGFFTSIAGSGITPRFLPSYSFWTDRGVEPYRMDKAIEVTKLVYARRDRQFTETDERVMRYVAEVGPKVEQ